MHEVLFLLKCPFLQKYLIDVVDKIYLFKHSRLFNNINYLFTFQLFGYVVLLIEKIYINIRDMLTLKHLLSSLSKKNWGLWIA